MADILDTVQKLINSPPGQLAASGVLAGIVWKFFERVEAVLTDNTKLEIGVLVLFFVAVVVFDVLWRGAMLRPVANPPTVNRIRESKRTCSFRIPRQIVPFRTVDAKAILRIYAINDR
jgi:hypothetical protein